MVDAAPLMEYLLNNRMRRSVGELSLLFHQAVARAALAGARRMREITGMDVIALSGGVFQNLLLREILVPLLRKDGFKDFLNRSVPPGDGGISLGQAYYVPE
jgi:hydrogenase maturation protein HypF